MALATNAAAGTIILTSDLHGSTDPYGPELTATGVVPGVYVTPSIVVDIKGRILYIEEGAEVACATTSSCGLVIPGRNIEFNAGEIDLHVATTAVKGVIQIGDRISYDGCCISIKTASTSGSPEVNVIGLVAVPTAGNLDVDSVGNLTVPLATNSTVGVVSVDGGNIWMDSTDMRASLQIADASTLGVVKIGSGFIIQVDGRLDVDWDIATDIVKGLIAVPGVVGSPAESDGLSVDGSGNLTFTYSSDIATTSNLGSVIVPVGGYLDIDGSGNLTVPLATNSTVGVVQSNNDYIDITAGEMNVGTKTGVIDVNKTYTKTQTGYTHTITPAAEYTPDFSVYNSYVITLTENIVMYNPTNMVAGGFYHFIIKQDASGSHTISWDTKFKFSSTPVLSTGTNAVDIVTMFVKDTNTIYCQLQKDFS